MRRTVVDLFWRMLTPSLADAWDAGYKACVDDNGPFDGFKATNPYRRKLWSTP